MTIYVFEVTNQLNLICINDDIMSPPAKVAKVILKSGDVISVPGAPKRPALDGSFDPSIPAMKPKRISFAPPVTGKTPKETKQAVDTNTAPAEIKDRWEHCTGTPLRVNKFHRDGSRVSRTCCMCKGQTSWLCIGCKSWFCLSATKDTETREKAFVGQKVKREEVNFEMSCFHQKHQAEWERAEGKEILDFTVEKIEESTFSLKAIREMYKLGL